MKFTKKVQIVGDDLYVTNLERLKGFKYFIKCDPNKLNQIGTVSALDVLFSNCRI